MGKQYEAMMRVNYIEKLKILQSELPPFVTTYFNGRSDLGERTKLSYAYDFKLFFHFLKDRNPSLKSKRIAGISLNDLSSLNAEDFDEYIQFLKCYTDKDGVVKANTENGIKRKMFAIRSLFSFLFERDMLKKNPTTLQKMNRPKNKKIIYMEDTEVHELLEYVKSGNGLSGRRQKRQEKNRCRDLAILTLLLGTGLRVSECVGIDVDDIDFDRKEIHGIIRKGGDEDCVFFGEEVKKHLSEYGREREKMKTVNEKETAFFLSNRRTRMCARSIEIMLVNYKNGCSFCGKKITPHKLRSTCGTKVYRETGDIALVADILGHKDINTTKRHYASGDIEKKRRSAEISIGI